MPSPFPGMDPYLEHPDLRPDVPNRLIAALGDDLSPVLRPRYYVALEERTYLEEPGELVLVGRPDLAVIARGRTETGAEVSRTPAQVEVELPESPQPERRASEASPEANAVGVGPHGDSFDEPVRETYLEVRSVAEGDVVTVIELLSPANKRPGTGRRIYLEKRDAVLSTRTSLVELDLLRSGEPMPTVSPPVASDYSILISRPRRRPKADLIAFSVRDPIPKFPLPLRRGEEEPTVDLGRVLLALYGRASYDLRIDYSRQPTPPLGPAEAEWAATLLREGGVGG